MPSDITGSGWEYSGETGLVYLDGVLANGFDDGTFGYEYFVDGVDTGAYDDGAAGASGGRDVSGLDINGYPVGVTGTGYEYSTATASWWLDGVETTLALDASGIPLTGVGWSVVNSIYYVDSAETDLPQSGTGLETLYSDPAAYYIGGVVTTLNSSGTGTWGGHPYVNGVRTDINLLTDLVAHWKLDETSGSRADSHGVNDLDDNSGVEYSAGKLGNAALFSGANFLSLVTLDLSSPFSVSLWIKAAAGQGSIGIFGVWPNTESSQAFCIVSQGDELNVNFRAPFVPVYSAWGGVNTGPTVCDGQWHHVCVTWDGTLASVYFDGTLDATADVSTVSASSDDLTFGKIAMSLYSFAPMVGAIDSVSIYGRSIEASEVSRLNNSGAGLDYEDFGGTPADNILLSGFPGSTTILGAGLLAA